jgi:glutaredoxin
MKKTLATSQICGPCHVLKNTLQKLNIEVETKDFINPENMSWFIKHGIKSVPRLVIEDGDNVEIIQGIDDIVERLKEKIND